MQYTAFKPSDKQFTTGGFFALRHLCEAGKFKPMCRRQALSASGGLLASKACGLNLMVFKKHRLKANNRVNRC